MATERGERESRIAELTEQYMTLRRLFGLAGPWPEFERIDLAMSKRRFRVQHLRKQIADTEAQVRWLESELEGLDKGRELLLQEAIDEILRSFRQTWSPTPVHGYRVWRIEQNGFHGFRQQWVWPTLEARCSRYPDEEVPHTDGRCGIPQCGIYAAKDVRRLLMSTGCTKTASPHAIGLVGMSGKVVEHRHGYRAARATVLALVILRGKAGPLFLDDPEEITAVFLDPSLCGTLRIDHLEVSVRNPVEWAIEYLEERERSYE
jgi:hypothetical protein